MFDKHLEETLNHAIELAHSQNCEFITVEHLLYALLDNNDAQTVFQFYTLDCDKLKKEIHQYIQINTPSLNKDTRLSATPTLAFQRVLQRALFVTQNQTQQNVSGFDVLISILSEENSYALYLLAKHGIEQHDVLSHIENFSQSKKVHKPLIFRLEQIDEEEENIQNDKDAHFYAHKSKHKSDDALDLFTVNLNEKARRGEIDPLIGRESEMQRTIQILHRRHKNNPLYVGDAGV
ncbi:MAG: Clp protease N-terminal domain-containing protein, partial [Candidatus Oxydemutatoraceae bacterium WSBS_2016_MAG_OTU14]